MAPRSEPGKKYEAQDRKRRRQLAEDHFVELYGRLAFRRMLRLREEQLQAAARS